MTYHQIALSREYKIEFEEEYGGDIMAISIDERNELERHANAFIERHPDKNKEKLAMIALVGIALYAHKSEGSKRELIHIPIPF